MTTKRGKIIVVDDNATNLAACKNVLKAFYEVYPVHSAAEMFELMESVRPDLVLLDVEMPEMNGYQAIKKLKSNSRFADIPVIFLTAQNDEISELEGLNLGAADYIIKPFSTPLLLRRIANQLLIVRQKTDLFLSRAVLKDYADNLAIKIRDKTKEALNLQSAVLSTVADLVEFRDETTGGHVARIQLYLKAMMEELIHKGTYADEIAGLDMDIFTASAQLHDVGKIAISDLILNKPGKLTPVEFEVMKTHVAEGVKAIEKIMRNTNEHVFLRHALLFAGTHHEKWDGSGYPMGLKGMDIPLEGRLMAIADTYDALTSVRPYKKAIPAPQAAAIIKEGRGTHFDPQLVDIFNRVSDRFEAIANGVRKVSELKLPITREIETEIFHQNLRTA